MIFSSCLGCNLFSGNIAYGKHADEGYGAWSQGFTADLAVDGITDPILTHHHCAIAQSKGIYHHAWMVDLKELYEIEKLTIYLPGGLHSE